MLEASYEHAEEDIQARQLVDARVEADTVVRAGQNGAVLRDADVFGPLPPGGYELSVELQGFKRWVQTGMTLDASSSATKDVTLETGGLTETVSVTAEATPLQTDVAVRKTVERNQSSQSAVRVRAPLLDRLVNQAVAHHVEISLARVEKGGRADRRRAGCVV